MRFRPHVAPGLCPHEVLLAILTAAGSLDSRVVGMTSIEKSERSLRTGPSFLNY